MDAYHARYPFLDAARDAVANADVDLSSLVRTDNAVVERGRERVIRALTEGTVESERRVSSRTELLSYPVARMLVSVLETPGAVEKYAAIEAATAHTRISEEVTTRTDRRTDRSFSLETVLAELGLDDDVQQLDRRNRRETAAYRISVDRYLQFVPEEDGWSLVQRELADGSVSVSQSELLELLRKAIEARVLDGLPFDVPPEIAEPLRPAVREIRTQLVGVEHPDAIDRFEPDAFPDCIATLLRRAGEEPLDQVERFTLITFLSGVGQSPETIPEICGIDDEQFLYASQRLAGQAIPFSPPSFDTMRAHGVCEGDHPDYDHPLEAYVAALPAVSEDTE
ncbi:hypothetical protein [Halocatena pleomorpha]|uniref:DNA primase large subunit PriL n=1 Tax=Halocatena pleomorpha TaxID=1785090 RepID=A0A3P3R797_9EURY|nr:hypothetical protein [Halocatena pleomorpha]RRJ28423.1 hypothetical protein EIK79_15725 [Halocatena pleomorpha]